MLTQTITKMKKFLFLTILFFVAQSSIVRAEQPIPSFHARIYHVGNFREHNNVSGHNPFQNKSTKEKRDMQIQATVANGNPKAFAIVYVYSLDMKDILGPFVINSGESLSIPIDERDWGAFITSEDHIYIDVWSSENTIRQGN
jgi:hypothetical protein